MIDEAFVTGHESGWRVILPHGSGGSGGYVIDREREFVALGVHSIRR
ncbi:hypothetical protein ACV229_33615 [Burkholderia sp. MR1-5-21]